MGRAKIKRGSTNIDMTAMCDVAFLLLSYFILIAEFKPAEAIEVSPPSSVASKVAPQTDAFQVSISPEGQVFVTLSEEMREEVINEISTTRNLNLTAEDKALFKNALFIGTPLSQLSQFVRIKPEDLHSVKLTGIPTDSTNNELDAWINAAANVYKGRKINWLIKGDNNSKYIVFRDVINAFKKNDVFKYQLVTNAEDIPADSELARKPSSSEGTE